MIPGEVITAESSIEINQGRKTESIVVCNYGDRPIQVGSHFHFFEVNKFLFFEREKAFGMRLDIPSGTSVRFEPGEKKHVQLVAVGGKKQVFGLNGLTNGSVKESAKKFCMEKAKEKGFCQEVDMR